ncbi:restriction endonuclease subunit S [Enterococcus montenegrensis]|uniref:restriction endonuclease subunit S n=1 Tax=Enterococcus montenegrensis TaxID=3031993 RepID=UPI00249EE526|nr:restriction endonuclease subunit S [Enterococcus montenegrensis]WHA10610.1 restriction endonuclease subunit S [Enterococcus montenegrensis]
MEKYFKEDGRYKVISIGSYGLDSKYVDQNIRAVSNEVTDGRVVHNGELTMVLNDKTANGTIIGRSLLIEQDNQYIINQRTEIISPKENFDSEFAYTILNGPFREKVKRIVQGGTQIYVNYSAVENLALELPCFEEQQKIGTLFKQLDTTITLHQRKLDLLKQMKKGFLQKMFPKDDGKVPELRFADFIDEWEQRKLGEVTDVKSGRDYKHLNSGVIPVYGTGGYMLSVDEALSYDEDAVGIGRKGTIDKPYILKAPFWTVDTLFYTLPNQEIDLNFIYAIFQNIDWKSKDESTGVPSLSKTTINKVNISVPSKSEQQKIGDFFQQLDQTITLHQEKLNKLKLLKKSYLQNMLI